MIRTIVALALAAILTGCGTTPPAAVVVSGNGHCHPSQALPAHKRVGQIKPADTGITPLFDLLADERRAHGDDVRDYNKLWDECVGKPESGQ